MRFKNPTRPSFCPFMGVLLVMASAVWGEEAAPIRLSFSDALKMAKVRHVEVIVSDERVRQAWERLSQARSTFLPQVAGQASWERQTRNLQAAGITLAGRDPLVGPFNAVDARATLTQTLFDAAALLRLRAARIGEHLSLAESHKARQDAMALVATLYLEAERAHQHLELEQAMLRRDEERLRLARYRHELGLGSTLDKEQAEAELASTRHQWHAASAEAIERQLDLAAALGLPAHQPIVFDRGAALVKQPLPSDHEVVTAIQQHPEIKVTRQALQQREAELAVEQAEWLPKVSGVANYGASGRTPDGLEATYLFGAQAELPIFEGGQRAARVREAASLVRETEARLNDLSRHLEAKALSAIQQMRQVRAWVQATEAESVVAARQLTIAQSRLQTGLGSELEVVEAQAQATSATDQHHEALATYRMAQVSLAHAMGDVEALIEPADTP